MYVCINVYIFIAYLEQYVIVAINIFPHQLTAKFLGQLNFYRASVYDLKGEYFVHFAYLLNWLEK